MEFDNQKMRLTNQLEFERSRDTMSESDWSSWLGWLEFCCLFSFSFCLTGHFARIASSWVERAGP